MKSPWLFPLLLALTVNVSSGSGENNTRLHQLSVKNGKKLDRPYKFIFELRKENTVIRHCGGAQINLNWFITAAECLDPKAHDTLRMLKLDPEGKFRREAMIRFRQIIHPEYNLKTKENNIGLLKAWRVINIWGAFLHPPVRPKLPSTKVKLSNLSKGPAVVFGWKDLLNSNSLMMTTLETNLINAWWCRLAYPLRFKGGQHLCVFGERGNGLSQEDVGAPLVITNSDNESELIGIATNIRPFTNALPMPMVFTSIAPYVEWIKNEAKKEANLTIIDL